MLYDSNYPYFFTATCLEWQLLLEQDKYKDIIIGNLRWLVKHHCIKVYAFVIMPNHIHYVWHVHPELIYSRVKGGHLKNTAQRMRQDLISTNQIVLLDKFYVGAKDREYQFWERNPKSVEVYTPEVIYQKIDYIHANPVQAKWNLCTEPKDYFYSSAEFYETGIDRFGFLTHIGERRFMGTCSYPREIKLLWSVMSRNFSE